jgi:GTP-binding protein LepA
MKDIRNFVIISHIDHGKSTLADRFLEITGTISKDKMQPQYLDMMDLERERGITIKMQPCTMSYSFKGKEYLFNLIDTPGHVDFSYEVSRSLAAVEGAVLLVDATKGIQAQTVKNLESAKSLNLEIIPAVNKIDLLQAKVEETEKEISDLLGVERSEILRISGKEGTNVEKILERIIEKVPPPREMTEKPLRALIFDSKFDAFKGVLAYVRVIEGRIEKGQEIFLMKGNAKGEAKEVGVFKPYLLPTGSLEAGEVGYIATGIKKGGAVRVGDTITVAGSENVVPLPGYREPQPMVFISIYPQDSNKFDLLKNALDKLSLNDASFTFAPETREGLGRGFQCGFLGLLHAEIITERMRREFKLALVLSSPSVLYKLFTVGGKEILVHTPADWPEEPGSIKETLERYAVLKVFTPITYLGPVMEIMGTIEIYDLKTNYISSEKAELSCKTPLREIITKNFYDKLKSVSQGFASMNYETIVGSESEWQKVDLVRLDVLVLGKKEEAFSKIVPAKEAQREGRKMTEKLKEALPPQLFSVPLQAIVGGKVIARETIKARRKDVIAPLYGGDYTRKRKLLEKQKKGKKELKEKGRIKIPPETYIRIMG